MITRKEGAVFDDYQEEILKQIEAMYPNTNFKATSGHRTALDQLQTIWEYAKGFAYPECTETDVTGKSIVDINGTDEEHYNWYRTWGEALHRGIIINPPIRSIVPYDYISNGHNKKGEWIEASNHIKPLDIDNTKETCPIDMSGKIDGELDIDRVNEAMEQCMESGVPIKSIVIERGNACVHLNTKVKAV